MANNGNESLAYRRYGLLASIAALMVVGCCGDGTTSRDVLTDSVADVLVTYNELLGSFDRKRVPVAIDDSSVRMGYHGLVLTVDEIYESGGDDGIKWFSRDTVLYPTSVERVEVYKYAPDENDEYSGVSTGIEYWVLKGKRVATYLSVTSAGVKLWQVLFTKRYNYVNVLAHIIMNDPDCLLYVNCVEKRYDIMLPTGYRNVFMYGVIKTSHQYSEVLGPPTCLNICEPAATCADPATSDTLNDESSMTDITTGPPAATETATTEPSTTRFTGTESGVTIADESIKTHVGSAESSHTANNGSSSAAAAVTSSTGLAATVTESSFVRTLNVDSSDAGRAGSATNVSYTESYANGTEVRSADPLTSTDITSTESPTTPRLSNATSADSTEVTTPVTTTTGSSTDTKSSYGVNGTESPTTNVTGPESRVTTESSETDSPDTEPTNRNRTESLVEALIAATNDSMSSAELSDARRTFQEVLTRSGL